MRYALPVLATLLIGLVTLAVHAEDAAPKTFSDAQRTAIEDIVKDYLVNKHPEVALQALQASQRKDQMMAETKSKEAISSSKDKIYNDPTSPVAGNPKGDVTVIEFYDYQCGYCKMASPAVEKLLKEDKNVKVVYKEFPILGPASLTASKAALASVRQGKFPKFHDALMDKEERLTDDVIYKIAKDVGLNVDKLKKDMDDEAIMKIIQDNLALGRDIGVRGTPMFIVNDQIYPGALQPDQLKKAVEDARATKPKAQ